MSEARQKILQRLRTATSTATQSSSITKTPLPNWDEEERIRRFTQRMEAVRAEVHRCEKKAWLEKLESICEEKNIGNLLYSPATPWGKLLYQRSQEKHSLPQLNRYDRDIEAWKETLFYHTDAGFTSTLGGIAETGTLVLWPDTHEPRLMSLVPPVHIAILETSKLYTTFAEVIEAQNWASQMPTNALLISGPSKSADIEQTLAYGVHGPKALIVLLV